MMKKIVLHLPNLGFDNVDGEALMRIMEVLYRKAYKISRGKNERV